MNSKQVYIRLLGYVKPYWKTLAFSVLLLSLLAATEPLFPMMMKPLLDEGFTNKDATFMQWVPIFVVGLFLVRGILTFTSSYASSWVANRLVTDLRALMFSQLTTLPTTYFDHHSSGSLTSKIAYDVNNVTGAATQALTTIVRDTLSLVALLGWLFWLDWKLTIVTLALIPFITIITRYFNSRLRNISGQSQRSMADLTHRIEEASSGHKIIKIFNAQKYEQDRFQLRNEQQRGLAMRATVAASALVPLVQILASFSIALIIWMALNQNDGGTVTAGGFVSYLTAMLMLLPPLKRLTGITATIQKGLAAAESVFEILDEPEEKSAKHQQIPQLNGCIQFNNISFTYPHTEQVILDNFSLEIKCGDTVALVGPSGSGKTTVSNLLARFYNTKSGSITIDEQSISDISLTTLRNSISLVSQDIRLFNDTIAANVAYTEVNPDINKVKSALIAANAWEFVTNLPNKLNTMSGQNGVRLSGGQRQRIAIARAFYKDAPILILDEATSALDTESERSIQAALEQLMKNRTTLVIAHRLSTIEHADNIVVMKDGSIVEQGRHAQLIKKSGLYKHYYKLQFKS
jgi:subfamily B ATP-binding cassette protein MsbA